MDEMQKALAGQLYDANYDPGLLELRRRAKSQLHDYNHSHPRQIEERDELLRKLLGKAGSRILIEPPFNCDYGFNIEVGDNFYANVGLVILDCAKVKIGNDVFIAPSVGIHTAGHPLDAPRRNQGLEYALPVTIEDNVWIGASVTILPGVTIGAGSVVAAGSLVREDVPPGVIYAGNPGRVVRAIGPADADRVEWTKPGSVR